MKDFPTLSRVEQQAFPGAQISYSEPPQVEDSDVIWMTANDHDGDWISGIFAYGDPASEVCVMHFYGNHENLRTAQYMIERLRAQGFAVLMFDYRGYGASRGRPREAAFYSDAELAYDWLRERYPQMQVVSSGWSVGAAVATYLAQTRDVTGLMLFSPPTNMVDVVSHVFPKDQIIIEEGMPFRFDSLERIRKTNAPVLLVHGRKDTVVPYEMSKQLEGAITSPLTRLDIATAGHEDLFKTGGDQLWETIYDFLHSLKDAPAAQSTTRI